MTGPDWSFQTHQSQCLVQDERFKGIDCDIFDDPHPPSMALSTLVIIEMTNALTRYGTHRPLEGATGSRGGGGGLFHCGCVMRCVPVRLSARCVASDNTH